MPDHVYGLFNPVLCWHLYNYLQLEHEGTNRHGTPRSISSKKPNLLAHLRSSFRLQAINTQMSPMLFLGVGEKESSTKRDIERLRKIQ